MEDTDDSISVFLKSITLCSAIGGFLSTYSLSILSGTLLFIKMEFHLTTIWHEVIVSTLIATAAVSSFAAGILSDWFGKKPVLLSASGLFVAGAAILAGAFKKEVIIAGQLITGVAVGYMYATAPRYIADFAPSHMRGRLVGVYSCFAAFGNMGSGLSAGIFSYYPWGWRAMFAVSSVPALFQCVWFCYLPESPRWLLSQGHQTQALENIQLVHGENWPRAINTKVEEVDKALYRVFTTRYIRRALYVGCGLQLIQQFAGVNAVQYYNSSIVQMAGTKSPVVIMWLTMAVFSCSAIGHVVSFSLVDKIGRRTLILVSLTGISISLMLISVSFYLASLRSALVMIHTAATGKCAQYSSCSSCIGDQGCGYCYADESANISFCLPVDTLDHQNAMGGLCTEQIMPHGINSSMIWEVTVCPSKYSLMTLIGMMSYLFSFGLGLGPVSWLINTEIYPTWASSVCNGCSTATSFASNLIVSMTFLTLTELLTTYGTFLIYFVISTVGMISMYFVLPETKDKSLDEVVTLINGPFCPCQGPSQGKTNYSYDKIDKTDSENEN